MSIVEGKRVLVVEDEFVIALTAEDMLVKLGATMVGPAASVQKALRLLQVEPVDAAMLDVSLNGERVDPVARWLSENGIPFVMTTGYDAVPDFPSAPVLGKPYTRAGLEAALVRVLKPGATRGSQGPGKPL